MTKIIRVKLTDKPSGEHRFASVGASDEDEAVAIVEGQEQGHVGYMIDPAEAKELERKFKEGSLTGRDKARLLSHHQDRPYKVQKVVK